MATEFLSYTGLQEYDRLIKAYIGDQKDAANQYTDDAIAELPAETPAVAIREWD